jgi:hypothetical protein
MVNVRKYSGARSMREYAASLGTDLAATKQLSVPQLVSADILHRNWQARGSDVKVGPPVGTVAHTAGRYSRRYSGGKLSVAAGSEQVLVDEAYDAVVYLAGVRCISRADDQTFGPDNEIYLVVTAVDGSNIVVDFKNPTANTVNSVLTDTYGGINGGDWIGIGKPIWAGRNPASLSISLVLWEEDEGNQEQARAEVEKQVRTFAPIVALAAGVAVGDGTAFLSQLPLVDKLTSSLSDAVSNALGLKDDVLGSGTLHLNYDELHGNPPPVNPPTNEVKAKTRGFPVTIGSSGSKKGEFRIYFYWETKPATHF